MNVERVCIEQCDHIYHPLCPEPVEEVNPQVSETTDTELTAIEGCHRICS